MTTPLFKVLANSIRLGQPPEPVAAIRALVEVISHQDAELNELRQRISLLTSRLQFFEAKTARLEAASISGGPASSNAPYSTGDFAPQSSGFPQQPFPQQTGIAPYQGLAAPAYLPKADPLPARSERPRSQRPPAFAELQNTDDPRDGEAGGTLVVARADIDAVVRHVVENEAPFPLAPAGGHLPSPDLLSATPFKPAASQPPPPMTAVPAGGHPTPVIGSSPSIQEREALAAVLSAEKRIAADEMDRDPAERAPAARESFSDPYVQIEPDDTFASTAENLALQMPLAADRNESRKSPATSSNDKPTDPNPRRHRIADEPSFDEVLTSIHKRKT